MPDLVGWYYIATLRLLLAGVCGAVIGVEREAHEKGAGLRTHILISIGACLFALIGLRMSEQFPGGDPMRLLQGMLLGVGFLAGGVIFMRRGSVKGLTTAAGLWVLTAVGLGCGLGYYFLAAFGTVLSITIIAWMRHIERHIHERVKADQPPPTNKDAQPRKHE